MHYTLYVSSSEDDTDGYFHCRDVDSNLSDVDLNVVGGGKDVTSKCAVNDPSDTTIIVINYNSCKARGITVSEPTSGPVSDTSVVIVTQDSQCDDGYPEVVEIDEEATKHHRDIEDNTLTEPEICLDVELPCVYSDGGEVIRDDDGEAVNREAVDSETVDSLIDDDPSDPGYGTFTDADEEGYDRVWNMSRLWQLETPKNVEVHGTDALFDDVTINDPSSRTASFGESSGLLYARIHPRVYPRPPNEYGESDDNYEGSSIEEGSIYDPNGVPYEYVDV